MKESDEKKPFFVVSDDKKFLFATSVRKVEAAAIKKSTFSAPLQKVNFFVSRFSVFHFVACDEMNKLFVFLCYLSEPQIKILLWANFEQSIPKISMLIERPFGYWIIRSDPKFLNRTRMQSTWLFIQGMPYLSIVQSTQVVAENGVVLSHYVIITLALLTSSDKQNPIYQLVE